MTIAEIPAEARAAVLARRRKEIDELDYRRELRRLEQDLYFVRDRIRVEVKDGWSALAAAHELLGAARRNVVLSAILVKAEQTRFSQGATDLLALQIREQALLEAQFAEVTAQADFFAALADYRAAIAADLRK